MSGIIARGYGSSTSTIITRGYGDIAAVVEEVVSGLVIRAHRVKGRSVRHRPVYVDQQPVDDVIEVTVAVELVGVGLSVPTEMISGEVTRRLDSIGIFVDVVNVEVETLDEGVVVEVKFEGSRSVITQRGVAATLVDT